METNKSELPEKIRNLDDEAWLKLLIQSINKRRIDDIDFPGFPPPDLQTRFVGSAYQQTLEEAFKFYKFVKSTTIKLEKPLNLETRFLDFGCGWGRFLRFFWKDIRTENLYGCDVLPEAIDTCLSTSVPGNLDLIDTDGILPYPDNCFDTIIAYSVFTHLPETVNLHWMRELARVSRPGCICCLTLEPRRFIYAMTNIPPDTDSAWHRSLAKYAHLADDLYKKFDAGKIAYIPTGGGDGLNSDVYGDAVVPLAYIRENWSSHFMVHTYLDDPGQFWQAVLVVTKK